jgi:hypothetical protein
VLSTFTVINLADSGPGSLRQAIMDANALPGADVIEFAPAVEGTIGLTSGQLVIGGDLSINGPGKNKLTVSGSDISRVVAVLGGPDAASAISVNVADLAIRQGRGQINAGGIFNGRFSNLTLTRVEVSDNAATGVAGFFTFGGGIHNSGAGATLMVIDSVISGNIVEADPSGNLDSFGGGIANLNGAKVTVVNSTIAGNQVFAARDGLGGGIHANADTMVTIVNSIVLNNQSTGSLAGIGLGSGGGGINIVRGQLTVTNSMIARNRAIGGIAIGGGISCETGTAIVGGSIIAGNEALGGEGGISQAIGGGIANFNILPSRFSSFSISNSIVSNNRAVAGNNGGNFDSDISVSTAFGGGVANAFNGHLEMSGCLLIGNQAIGGNGATHHAPNISDVGVAHGGGVANFEGGNATIRDSAIVHNRAVGGEGNNGTGSLAFVGTGTGGGIDNSLDDSIFGFNPTLLSVVNSIILHNEAVGGNNNSGNGNRVFAGAGLGGGLANYLGVTASISGSDLAHNAASGGVGNVSVGGALPHGFGIGGGILNALGNVALTTGEIRAANILNVSNSTLEHNKAKGGAGVADARGGDGWGGAIASLFEAITDVSGSTLTRNHAIGGRGNAGGDGGDGKGGGAYNDVSSTFTMRESVVTKNHSNGGEGGTGGSDGHGFGGGIYNEGEFFVDEFTVIKRNKAATAGDDVFGTLTPI